MNHVCVTGVTKVSRRSRHSAHLHWEHCCELVSVEALVLQSRPLWCEHRSQRGRRDAQRPAGGGGGARGGSVCRGRGQRGDSHQESLSAGSLRSGGHHVPQRLQPRTRCSPSSLPQTARRVRSPVLCVHRGHHTFLHRGKRDSCAYFLFSHPPSRVQQLGLPSWSVLQKISHTVTQTHTCTDAYGDTQDNSLV